MTNILKSRVYVPPGIDLTWRITKVNLKTNTENIDIIFPPNTKFVYKNRFLAVYPPIKRVHSAIYGCLLRKIKLLTYGLLIPFQVRLNFIGRGYTVKFQENKIIIQLGHSHNMIITVPSNVKILALNKKATQFKLSSYSLDDLTQFASRVVSFRKPNPYHGRGIIWLGKIIRRKELKKKSY
jgi:large subunit ribosomal protein L6